MIRLNEGTNLSGAIAMNRLWKARSLGVNLRRMVYERIAVPSVLTVYVWLNVHGAERWKRRD